MKRSTRVHSVALCTFAASACGDQGNRAGTDVAADTSCFADPAVNEADPHPDLHEGHVVQLRPASADPREGDNEDIPSFLDPSEDTGRIARELPQQWGSEGRTCPEGTVPIRRLTMDILRKFRTLEEFFRKQPPHDVDGPTNLHQYATASKSTGNWGAKTALNVWVRIRSARTWTPPGTGWFMCMSRGASTSGFRMAG